MKRIVLFSFFFAVLLALIGCGGGGGNGGNGGGSGGGNVPHSYSIPGVFHLPNDPWVNQYVFQANRPSLSWTMAATSTALTQDPTHLRFFALIGVPVSPYGFAVEWYSRLDTYGWNGQGPPPLNATDNSFTVASALAGSYFWDINNSNLTIGMRGFYTVGWPSDPAFNNGFVQLQTGNVPVIAQLGRTTQQGTYQQFVVVTGLDWETDQAGNLTSIDALHIYDPSGLLPAVLNATNSNQLGVSYLGFSWMVPTGGPQPLLEKGQKPLVTQTGANGPLTWPTKS